MDRRGFLTLLAMGTSVSLSGCAWRHVAAVPVAGHPGPTPTDPVLTPGGWRQAPSAAAARVPQTPTAGVGRLPQRTATAPAAPMPAATYATHTPTTIDRLPDNGSPRMALTVDDGASTEVLDAYLDFVIASGIRITFFVNGAYPSWTVLRPKLGPLVESGQVQLGNHTWNHPNITRLDTAGIVDQLERNEKFLRNTYGVAGRPYFRPPYGRHDAVTDRITGGLGFDRTVMWFGTLGDASVVTPAQIVAAARRWFLPNRIVIGHANHPAVTHVYPDLVEIIRERALQTVTLREVFGDAPLVP